MIVARYVLMKLGVVNLTLQAGKQTSLIQMNPSGSCRSGPSSFFRSRVISYAVCSDLLVKLGL